MAANKVPRKGLILGSSSDRAILQNFCSWKKEFTLKFVLNKVQVDRSRPFWSKKLQVIFYSFKKDDII